MGRVDALFGTGPDLTWVQECARALIVFAYGLLAVRLSGRRIFGKWSALDIVISIVIGSNLSRVMTGNAQFFGTLAATTALLVIHRLLAQLVCHFPRMSSLIEGTSVPLLRNGSLDDREVRRRSISAADLKEALHVAGLERIEDARFVTLEPSGKIVVH